MRSPEHTGLLGIAAVSRMLGVAPGTLRTWERRYRLVVPRRGRHGRRLYDPDQIVLLRRVLTQVRRGRRAGAAHDVAGRLRPLRTSRALLRPSSRAPGLARRTVDRALGAWRDETLAYRLRLVVSELVTNGVVHGRPREPIALAVRRYADRIEVRVETGGYLSIASLHDTRPDRGHGLEIVDVLVDAWSIETAPEGTRISVRVPAPSGRSRKPDV